MKMNRNRCIAFLTLRLILGLIFLMQGFGKVVTWGVENVYKADFFHGTFKNLLPDVIICITAYYTSYVELIGGLLVLIGLKTNYALYALASVLVIVSFGHGMAEPIWDLSAVISRTLLLSALLIMPQEWNKISIDYLFTHKSQKIID